GVTMGDAAGVGPEIVLKAYAGGEAPYDIVVFGDLAILEFAAGTLGIDVPFRRIENVTEYRPGALNVRDLGILASDALTVGEISKETGRAAWEYVVAATQSALAGSVDAVVTLPMNKEATRLSDPTFTGHTELIAGLCGAPEVVMMLASESLTVSHVSTHVPMEEATRLVTRRRVRTVIELTDGALKHLMDHPRIGVAGLNPHAGEHGMFGRQEEDEIAPAVADAREQGIDVEGPLPPDTIFYQAVRKKRFDAVVCMYHDQGHIPVKLLDFEGAVNVTLGLPIVRTSVDHGTAFDIAYKGVASTESFVNALAFAARLLGT
ncbi:MAG: 4-hydroxythreonine-4-phosphate dehydrogenase PdxA, partial [Candidatus Brocadiia bacterium]|nr:4-hydroxythreonine-4-phosphate dehydrogenase PdxA [Candidatus Brocadiia bacterium]